MATIDLDTLREKANAKYDNLTIPVGDGEAVTLVNALRLPKEKRAELVSLQDNLSEADQDEIEEHLSKAIYLIAHSDAGAKRLLDHVDGDLALLMTIFESYSSGTQAGEA